MKGNMSPTQRTEPTQFALGKILKETIEGFASLGNEPGDYEELADRFILACAGRFVLIEKDEYDGMVKLLREAKERVVPTIAGLPTAKTAICPVCKERIHLSEKGTFLHHGNQVFGTCDGTGILGQVSK